MEAKGLLRAFTLSGVTFGSVEGGRGRPATQIAASTWTLTAVCWVFILRIGAGVRIVCIFTHYFGVLTRPLKCRSCYYDSRKTHR